MRSRSFTVELPDSVAEALRLAPPDAEAQVRKELALALYARGILGFGKARELCGLTKWQFEELLGRRKVVRPFTTKTISLLISLMPDSRFSVRHETSELRAV
jgi:predicted HTH domain antitoxin